MKKCKRHKCAHYERYEIERGKHIWICGISNLIDEKIKLCVREATGDFYKPKAVKNEQSYL